MRDEAKQRRVVGIVGIAIVLCAGALYAYDAAQPIELKITGEVVDFDRAARTATIEIVRKNGEIRRETGSIDPACVITLNREAALESDVRRGDTVEVQARIYRVGYAVVDRVNIVRPSAEIASNADLVGESAEPAEN